MAVHDGVRDAAIVATARTPIGTAHKGSLVDVEPTDLGSLVVREALGRTTVDPELVDDLILGESRYGGGDMARYIAVDAGLEHVPGLAHNRHCATGLASIATAAGSVRAGMDDVVIAGGVHSASTAPRLERRQPGTDDWGEWLPPSHPETPDAPCEDMSITVGWNAAVRAGVTRDQMDAWALRSHRRAIAAIDTGAFDDEVVPVGDFAVDEHPRRDTSLEKLASLKPLHPEIDGFSITAGNASGRNDGAAAVVVADRELAERSGAVTLAIVRAWASTGVAPANSGLGPTTAVPKALGRAGLEVGDVDLWEINEAFASVAVANTRLLGIDHELVNVVGSGCSLGHPTAMTGTRMVISLIHELRRRGGGVAVATMCTGGGMGSAMVLEVPHP
jgi:acetyl-CoA acetyltransferase family protein